MSTYFLNINNNQKFYIKRKGLIRGFELGSKRILKCHPIKSLGGSEGLDFVPKSNKKESKNEQRKRS